jgi:hypothetical protein
MSERRELRVIGPDGSQPVSVTVATEPPWTLALELPDGQTAEAQAPDLFAALMTIRQQLEDAGLLVCCQGARPDVYPSGMSSQMSGGRLAYHLHAGRRSTADDLVDILDPAECKDVVTVQEQRAAVRRLR